jgi:hypothetical protein
MPISQDVPLHIALAWVLTRDHDFIFEINRSGYSPLEKAIEEINHSRSEKILPVVSTVPEAWSLLRSAVAEPSFEIHAIPFEKGEHITAPGVFGKPYTFERDVNPNKPPIRIPKDQIPNLVMDDAPNEIRLRPTKWVSEGGRWWRDVKLDWQALLKVFGDDVRTVRVVKHKKRGTGEPPAMQLAVINAITYLWPNGEWKMLTPKLRNPEIVKWIRSHFGLKEDAPHVIDKKTIARAIKRLKDDHKPL